MSEYNVFKNIGSSSGHRTLPVQTLPKARKTKEWLKTTVDFLYNEAVRQKRQNLVFSKVRRMTEGDFVYESVDIEKTLYGDEAQQLKKLTNDAPLPTHLKHFDFLGIIANAIESVFAELDDKYRVIAIDETSTNEYIRARTENLHKYAQALFQAEVNKMLLANGINPDRTEFNSEEEKQAYIQQLDVEVQKYTPEEFEKTLSKNFKVLATEWANNVLIRDKEKFYLDTEDRDRLIDYILTGRWFRHYRVGYDYYDVEDWMPEEVFFSQYTNTKFPQKSEFIGRLTNLSITDTIAKHGHLMTTKQQEKIGDFFNQGTDFKKGIYPFNNESGDVGQPFATNYIVPFNNYFDHQVNLQMESFLGVPLAQTMKDNGEVERHWIPRAGSMQAGLGNGFAQHYRNDIDVSSSTIEVMEVYWTSFELMGILIYRNEVGALDIKQVSEELMKDFIREYDIKVKRNVSLEEMQSTLRRGELEEYENTITWHYLPQSWYAVVLKQNNGVVLDEDMILWGKATEQQIRGNSDYYEIMHPVGGIITKSTITKAFPYQQLHNICLNQISELLADEPGTFYSFDINAIPDDLKGDQDTEEALFTIMDTIKLTKMLPVNLSRQQMQGNVAFPNIFQKNEVVFANQVQYRREMAEYFKQQAFSQIGITPQLLGAPINAETAEGVKQQATATYALINNIIDDFTSSKARANELHIAIAQICEVNGKSSARLVQNSDGANIFIDILAEDGEYFPLRKLSIQPAASSKDRPVVKFLQNMLMSDNTIQKDFSDIVDIFTNPHTLKLKQIAREMRMRQEGMQQQDKQFQDSQLTKQIEAQKQNLADDRKHQVDLVNLKGEWQYKEAYLTALGRDATSTKDDNQPDIQRAYELNLKESAIIQDGEIRRAEIERKMNMDETTKKVELEKLKQKAEEIRLKNRQIASNEYIATINKN